MSGYIGLAELYRIEYEYGSCFLAEDDGAFEQWAMEYGDRLMTAARDLIRVQNERVGAGEET